MKFKTLTLIVALTATLAAQPRQTSQDEYTLYELLAPETAAFKIDYEVTATTPGATASTGRLPGEPGATGRLTGPRRRTRFNKD